MLKKDSFSLIATLQPWGNANDHILKGKNMPKIVKRREQKRS